MLTYAALFRIFDGLNTSIDLQQTLCLVGDAACVMLRLHARQTAGVDVWKPASHAVDSVLERAARTQGLGYNPTNLDPAPGYIQTVDPGIVQMPPFANGLWPNGEASRSLWKGDKLHIVCPPPAILVASKMVRATNVDMDDAACLMLATATPRAAVVAAARSFPLQVRSTIRENLPLLDVLLPNARVPAKTRTQDQR